jgi:ceramide glucosyltransferase
MVSTLLVSMIVVGWLVVLAMSVSQRKLLQDRRPAPATERPPLSILKPLKGADPDLETNLRSFFRLDYPAYEVIFGVADPRDPGLEVARRVASHHPGVPVHFVVDRREVGFNPKANNLANMMRVASSEILVISDSNVSMSPDQLDGLVAELHAPGVGLVTAPVRALGGSGTGGPLERAQLNTFVMGGVAAVSVMLGRVCAMGKTMLLRRSDLDRVGGWCELGRYLAEDQVLGEKIESLGLKTVVSDRPVDQRLGRLSIADFASRHVRWAKLRRHLAPLGYGAEIVTNPVAAAVLLLAVNPGRLSVVLALTTLAVMTAASVAAGRRVGSSVPLPVAPLVEVARGLLLMVLWPVPFFSSSVAWRGRRLTIGRRTLLRPDDAVDWAAVDDLTSKEAAA